MAHHSVPYGARYYYHNFGPYYGRIVRSDEEIEADIRNALIHDSWVDANSIGVDVNNGIVTLSGTVASLLEKRSAGDDVMDTLGVVDVINTLTIRQRG